MKHAYSTALLLALICLAGCVTHPPSDPTATADDSTVTFYFAQISDIHCCDADHIDRLASIVDQLNRFPRKLEFVAVTGDISTEPGHPEAYTEVKSVLAKLNAPVHAVPGNHDIAPPGTNETTGAAGADLVAASKAYKEAFGPILYTAEHQGVVFVFTYTYPYFHRFVVDGGDPLAWTRTALEGARGKPVIVVEHASPLTPPYTNDYLRAPPEELVKPWSDLLNSNHVRAVVCGHFHGDELGWLGNVPVYVCPSVAGYWGYPTHYRIYEYSGGRLWSFTQTAQPKPRARGVFSGASASTEGPENSALAAIDRNPATRWESRQQSDPEWFAATLTEPRVIREADIQWETASAKDYDVQVSDDGTNWLTVATVTNGLPGEDRAVTFEPVTARHVRVYGRTRATRWGYSIWEFDVR